MRFYVGLHQPSDAKHFQRCCISISITRLGDRLLPRTGELLLDSGAFTTLLRHGCYPAGVQTYVDKLRALHKTRPDVRVAACVTQDYMCEPVMLTRTGLTIADHQRLTIERYDAIVAAEPPYSILPVLQGYAPQDYADHVHAYGKRLALGAWVGVGSVCKRNAAPSKIVEVLTAIHDVRLDLRLHGFGVKRTALEDDRVRAALFSADSMAWSFAARYEGRNQNSYVEAINYADRIEVLSNPGVFA